MTWIEIANLRGPVGYNATGAAEDDAAIAAFMKETAGTTLVGQALRDRATVINVVTEFGAVADGSQVTTASMTAGSPLLTIGSQSFTSADVGKSITVAGALSTNPLPLTATIAAFVSATSVNLSAAASVTVSSARAEWGTDNAPMIQAAVDGAFPGKTIWFPSTGSGRFYLIASTITVDASRPSIRFLGNPRDAYNGSIRCNTHNATMFMIKAAGVVFENLALWGGSNVSAAVTGIEFWGDLSGNGDSRTIGVSFWRCNVGARTRSRNNTFMGESLFVISGEGIIIDGPDATYHTGAVADSSMRGNVVKDCRFDGNGSTSAAASIRITPEAKFLRGTISGNRFDGPSRGRHIVAVGTASNPVQRLTMENNVHHDTPANAYDLSYVQNSQIDGAKIVGYTNGWFSGHGINLDNCVNIAIDEPNMLQIGCSAVKVRNSSGVQITSPQVKAVGLDTTAGTFDAIDVDSTVSLLAITGGHLFTGPSYGISGDSESTVLRGVQMASFTLGNINSNTVQNATSEGANSFIEGKLGRLEDTGRKFVETAAGVAKVVAHVFSGVTNGSFILEIEYSGQDAYFIAKRQVRPDATTPIIVVVGSDVSAYATVALSANGSQGVTLTLTTSATRNGSLIVKAFAGGAPGSTTKRGVRVDMV